MAIHFAFGTLMGCPYGCLAKVWPTVTLAGGTALWLGADEVAVPVLGLTNPPARNPPQMHAAAWLIHLVYGAVLELGRRLLRRWFCLCGMADRPL